MKLDLQTVALVAIAAALWVAVFQGFKAFQCRGPSTGPTLRELWEPRAGNEKNPA